MASTGEGLWGFLFWLCLSGAAGVLLWFLFADRSRGVPRCPRCWYDMRGLLVRVVSERKARGQAGDGLDDGAADGTANGESAVVCSECGTACKKRAALHHTRRHWRLASLAVIPLLGAWLCSSMGAGVREKGWPRLVPTTLLCILPPFDEMEWTRLYLRDDADIDGWRRKLLDDFVDRAKEDRIAGWQTRLWLWRTNIALNRRGQWFKHDTDWEVLHRLESNIIRDQGGTITRAQAVELISRQTGVEIDVDWDDGDGSAATTLLPIASLDGLPADQAIDQTFTMHQRHSRFLDSQPRAWTAHNGRVSVRSWTEAKGLLPVLSGFEISDLIEREISLLGEQWEGCGFGVSRARKRVPRAELVRNYNDSLRRVITATVDPMHWLDNGGDTASLNVLGNKLLVLAPAGTHPRIQRLLDQLRDPCDNPERVSDPEVLREARAEYAAWRARRLTLPSSVNSLSLLTNHLRERERMIVCLDSAFRLWTGKDRAMIDPPRLFGQDYPDSGGLDRTALLGAFSAADILDRACENLTERGRDSVAWWSRAGVLIIGAAGLQASDRRTIVYDISDFTDEDAAQRLDRHLISTIPAFSDCEPSSPYGIPVEELADDLKHILFMFVQTESWQDNGGDEGSIIFFSNRFIITAPTRTHVAVADLLAMLRGARKERMGG